MAAFIRVILLVFQALVWWKAGREQKKEANQKILWVVLRPYCSNPLSKVPFFLFVSGLPGIAGDHSAAHNIQYNYETLE